MLYHYIIICIVNVVGWLELFAKTRVHRTVKGEGIAVCRDKTRRFTRRAPKNPKECNDSEKAWRREMGSANRTNLQRYITFHFVNAFFVPGHELVILFDAHNQCTSSNALLCYSAELTLCLHWFLMFFPKRTESASKDSLRHLLHASSPKYPYMISHPCPSSTWEHMDEWSYLWLLCFSRKLIFHAALAANFASDASKRVCGPTTAESKCDPSEDQMPVTDT